MQTSEQFSGRVENYILYRPHYPKDVLLFIEKQLDIDTLVIADIGSGTGISSEIFLKNGNTVYAIEPNKEMRESAEYIHQGDKNFISINATAEDTSLNSGSIDLIVCGQAFHWFNKTLTKREFQRIGSCKASLLLMWNERKKSSAFQQAYENTLCEIALPNEAKASTNMIDERAIRDFFSPNRYVYQSFSHSQHFDFEGLKGRLQSSSYAPRENHPNHCLMMPKLKHIFDLFRIKDKVEFEYDCKIYFGQLR